MHIDPTRCDRPHFCFRVKAEALGIVAATSMSRVVAAPRPEDLHVYAQVAYEAQKPGPGGPSTGAISVPANTRGIQGKRLRDLGDISGAVRVSRRAPAGPARSRSEPASRRPSIAMVRSRASTTTGDRDCGSSGRVRARTQKACYDAALLDLIRAENRVIAR
jgi:hypothetical protein